MRPPFLSYVTFNRLGLTARNLSRLLESKEDFELFIIDNNSCDHTWEFLNSLTDARIKNLERFETNRGHIYSTNYNLSLRKKDQFFITVDNDVWLETLNFWEIFSNIFYQFNEVGLLGAVRDNYFDIYKLPMLRKVKDEASYLEITNGFIEGCFQALSPKLIEKIGYWSEESCYGDIELCYRIMHCTDIKMGFVPQIILRQEQKIECNTCILRNDCQCLKEDKNCFDISNELYVNPSFRNRFCYKYDKIRRLIDKGQKDCYCGSIHDMGSMNRGCYNKYWALENFRYYMENGNKRGEQDETIRKPSICYTTHYS